MPYPVAGLSGPGTLSAKTDVVVGTDGREKPVRWDGRYRVHHAEPDFRDGPRPGNGKGISALMR